MCLRRISIYFILNIQSICSLPDDDSCLSRKEVSFLLIVSAFSHHRLFILPDVSSRDLQQKLPRPFRQGNIQLERNIGQYIDYKHTDYIYPYDYSIGTGFYFFADSRVLFHADYRTRIYVFTSNYWLKWTYENFLKRKYKNMEGYHSNA